MTNCYMGVEKVQCDQLLHGRERYSATNCYMGGRGKCDQLLHGRER